MSRKERNTGLDSMKGFDKNRAISGSDRSFRWDEEPLYRSPRHPESETFSISELAGMFDISTRTIRYYEELGLLHPKRSEGGQRIFSKREKTRLRLIFRGKKYGFSLDEIREMIELFDVDPSGKKQLRRTIEYGREKIEEVTERIDELAAIRGEMERMLEDFEERLNKTKDNSEVENR